MATHKRENEPEDCRCSSETAEHTDHQRIPLLTPRICHGCHKKLRDQPEIQCAVATRKMYFRLVINKIYQREPPKIQVLLQEMPQIFKH